MVIPLAFSQYLPGLLLAAGVGLLSFIALINLRSRLSQRSAVLPTKSSREAREMMDEIREQARTNARRSGQSVDRSRTAHSSEHDDAQAILGTEDAVRRLLAQIDARTAHINRLIAQADDRIHALSRTLSEIHDENEPTAKAHGAAASETASTLRSRKSAHSGTEPKTNDEPIVETSKAASTPRPPKREQSATTRATKPSSRRSPTKAKKPRAGSTAGRAADSAESMSADDLTARVCALADRGESAVAIAQELSEHIGKIELILALRRSESGESVRSH